MNDKQFEELRQLHLNNAVNYNIMGHIQKSIQQTSLSLHAAAKDEKTYLSTAKIYKVEPPVWLFKKKYDYNK